MSNDTPESQEFPTPCGDFSEDEPPSRDLRILVVDSEELGRRLITDLFQEEGHEVVDVVDAETALDTFAKAPFPLVIIDIDAKKRLSGFELMAEVKRMSPGTEVVVTTEHASVETSIRALKEGAYDYLIKPFGDLDEVLSVVNRVAEKIELSRRNENLVQTLQHHARELERASRSLKELALRDGLTRLFNQRHFLETLDMELARARRVNHPTSVIMIDVDHFKHYNETNGHPVGDRLLRSLAKILRDSIRLSDVAARYGGEEFILLLPETPKNNALILAERIRQRVEAFPFEGKESQPQGTVTISIGVAGYPEDGPGSVELMETADRALYRAKESGRNSVIAA